MYELTGGVQPRNVEPMNSGNAEWQGLMRTLTRRRGAFVAIFLTFVLLVVVITLLTPKSYTTTVKLIAGDAAPATTSGGDQTGLPILNALRLATGTQSAETYATLIMQGDVAQSIIDQLQLKATPGELLGHIVVKPVTNTSILEVDVTWKDPKTSAAIANTLGTVFVQREREIVGSSASAALAFVNDQLPSAMRRMRTADSALAAYESSHHIADITSQTQGVIQNLAGLESRIAATEVEQRQNEAQLAAANTQLARVTPMTENGGSVAPNPVLASLQQQLASVTTQLETARQQYTDAYPQVIALKQQQQQLQAQIAKTPTTIVSATNTTSNPLYTSLRQQASTAQSAIATNAAQLATLRAQREALQPQLQRLPDQANRLAELRSAATSAEDVYNALQKKANDALVSRSTALSDVTVISAADPAIFSTKPNVKTNITIGIIVGLALAVAGVFLLEFFDNSIKDERDIAEFSLPVLASIPRLETKGKLSLPWVRSLTIESFLQLVTSLRYASDHPIRTLAFTSPLQGDGKSTIAMNTAIALAEVQPRVLLIDADLRRPSLHAKFEIRNEHGLSDVLVGNALLANVARSTRHAGLDLVTSGTRTPNPYKLLQSDRFDQFLEDALQVYRMVIIDGPALNPVIDGAVLCKKAEGTIMVVSANATDLRSTKRALLRLQSVGVKEILGMVVNRTMPRRSDYDDYYLGAGTPSLALPSDA